MKKGYGTLTNIRMLTDQHYIRHHLKERQNGVKMMSKWQKQVEMAFLEKKPVKRHEKEKRSRCGTPTSVGQSTDQRQLTDVIGSGAKLAQVGGKEKDMEMKKIMM